MKPTNSNYAARLLFTMLSNNKYSSAIRGYSQKGRFMR
jgi:hypothetical protein